MNSKLITNSLKLILILMLIYGLFEVLYSHAAQLTVPSDVRTETMIFNPQDVPNSPTEGQIYYNQTDKQLYYYNGEWETFSNPDRAVATKVVAAVNSLGTICVTGRCFNPRADYACDGTDDQEKINTAINDLPATGGAVYLLEGTYNISTTLLGEETEVGIVLDSNHNNTALIGTGKGTVLKVVSGASTTLYVINGQDANGILISQLMIDGNSKAGGDNYRGIAFNNVSYSKIDKVWVENMHFNGMYLDNTSHTTVSNNNAQGNGYDGIRIFGSNNTVSNNNAQGNTDYGILLIGHNNIISNNNVQDNTTGYGIYVSDSYNTISNNNVQGNTEGIHLQSSSNSIISNNNVQGNSSHGIFLSDSSNNTVSNNNVQGNTRQGIYLSYSSNNNTIIANVVKDNGSEAGYYCGIVLDGSDSNIISSNRVSDTNGLGYGIDILNDTCDNNYLIGNLIDQAGYEKPIQDLGTGTKYTDKAKLTFERALSQNPGSGGTINATATYIPLNPTGSSYNIGNITDGKSGGDLLILENINATNSITIMNGTNTRLRDGTQKPLSQNKTLMLIWDGNGTAGVGDWVEIGDNQ